MDWLFAQSWKVYIFVTFIKLPELHQSLYKSQINSINNTNVKKGCQILSTLYFLIVLGVDW